MGVGRGTKLTRSPRKKQSAANPRGTARPLGLFIFRTSARGTARGRRPRGPRRGVRQPPFAMRQAVSPVVSPTLSGTQAAQSSGSASDDHTTVPPRYWMVCTARQRRPAQS